MKLSLGRKIVFMMIIIAVILTATCIAVSCIVFKKIMEKEYIITADSMAGTVAVTVDSDRMQAITEKVMKLYNSSEISFENVEKDDPQYKAYCEQFSKLTEDEDYIEIRETMRSIQAVNEVDSIYTVFIDPDKKLAVYIVDADDEDEIMYPGCVHRLEERYYQYLDDLTQGFPAYLSKTKEYGYIVTSSTPVFNSDGDIVCFASIDISMNDVVKKENSFLLLLTVILLVLTVIITVMSIMYVNKKIVKPINMLSKAAGQYGQNQRNGVHNEFSSLEIHTGDELEILLGSMIQMEHDIDSYIESLTQTKEQLSTARQHADDMHELAHMDSLTGIRNRMAYDKEIGLLDKEIGEGLKDFGIAMVDLNFLKNINDTYGHECGNAAIIELSTLICEVFKHSPVFRIGGDEFAVILKNHDHDMINELAKEFDRRIGQLNEDESLPEYEKITAALGFAMFDEETDRCADDVFKRADKRMYEQKKKMKALRN